MNNSIISPAIHLKLEDCKVELRRLIQIKIKQKVAIAAFKKTLPNDGSFDNVRHALNKGYRKMNLEVVAVENQIGAIHDLFDAVRHYEFFVDQTEFFRLKNQSVNFTDY